MLKTLSAETLNVDPPPEVSFSDFAFQLTCSDLCFDFSFYSRCTIEFVSTLDRVFLCCSLGSLLLKICTLFLQCQWSILWFVPQVRVRAFLVRGRVGVGVQVQVACKRDTM